MQQVIFFLGGGCFREDFLPFVNSQKMSFCWDDNEISQPLKSQILISLLFFLHKLSLSHTHTHTQTLSYSFFLSLSFFSALHSLFYTHTHSLSNTHTLSLSSLSSFLSLTHTHLVQSTTLSLVFWFLFK